MEEIKYENSKEKIRSLVNQYEFDNDLMKLAEAYVIIRRIFRYEDFPIVDYLKSKNEVMSINKRYAE